MTQEDKELLLRDLCARLPYNLALNVTEPGDERVNFTCFLTTDIIKEISGKSGHFKYVPYLRSMLNMTDEERKIYESFFSIGEYSCGGSFYGKEYEYIDSDSDDIVQCISLIDWLNEYYFDYRGLIEKGLALEAPEEMYKTE